MSALDKLYESLKQAKEGREKTGFEGVKRELVVLDYLFPSERSITKTPSLFVEIDGDLRPFLLRTGDEELGEELKRLLNGGHRPLKVVAETMGTIIYSVQEVRPLGDEELAELIEKLHSKGYVITASVRESASGASLIFQGDGGDVIIVPQARSLNAQLLMQKILEKTIREDEPLVVISKKPEDRATSPGFFWLTSEEFEELRERVKRAEEKTNEKHGEEAKIERGEDAEKSVIKRNSRENAERLSERIRRILERAKQL